MKRSNAEVDPLRLIRPKIPSRPARSTSQLRDTSHNSLDRRTLETNSRTETNLAAKIVALKKNLAQLQKLMTTKIKVRKPEDVSTQLQQPRTLITTAITRISTVSTVKSRSTSRTIASRPTSQEPPKSKPAVSQTRRLLAKSATRPVPPNPSRLVCRERLPAGPIVPPRPVRGRADTVEPKPRQATLSIRPLGRSRPAPSATKTVERVCGPGKARLPPFGHETYISRCPAETAMSCAAEADYQPECRYLDQSQHNLRWEMRAILLDWLAEVSANYFFKRETFHYAVNYVDRFLSVVENVERGELQLVGVSALFLAAKMEEVYTPKLSSMVAVSDGAYSPEAVRECELRMYHIIEMRITPPTLAMWAQLLTAEWDRFVRARGGALRGALPLLPRSLFREPSESSYALFRELMQLSDTALMDVLTLQYKPRALACALLYIVLGFRLQQFDRETAQREFPQSSLYLLDKDKPFNAAFEEFTQQTLGLKLGDLLPTVQYGSMFIGVALDCAFPLAAAANPSEVLEGHYEEFLAYQTHSPANLSFVLSRKNR